MARFDLPLDALRDYRPDVHEPADFDEFWAGTLAAARAVAEEPRVERVDSPLRLVDVFDLTFSGFGGDPVKAWMLTPAGATGPRPAVIEYNGYGGGRGMPHERLHWAASGYTWILMDTRGQGSGWGTGGDTPDLHGSGPAVPGFMTRGILDADDYYYRRVFTDAVLLVDAARALPEVDPDRILVTGGSQGGGITLAVAGLAEGLVAAMPDVPFLCHFERAVGLTDAFPYQEVVQYLSVHRGEEDAVFRTLSYFDGVNFARRASAPALFSTALHDPICPPSTVFAAANHYRGPMEIEVYPFNQHEGGLGVQWERQAAFAREVLAAHSPGKVS